MPSLVIRTLYNVASPTPLSVVLLSVVLYFIAEKSCPKLTSPENGILLTVISTFRFGDEAYFKCLDGFVMIGEGKLTCGDNKAWSASSPTCVGRGPF